MPFYCLSPLHANKGIWLAKTIKHYTPTEASEKLRNSRSVLLLDVKTLKERKAQSIKKSIHIPLAEISSRVDELNKFRNQEIICYCKTGIRSLSAASKLKRNGFNSANLRGGIVQWNSEGLK
ncbi:MAG: rhodanese-like domain-containing protein [Bacteroidetes bacterium]|nr:rhodanese-like domain-containing protein [Bacteroidota bacterium]